MKLDPFEIRFSQQSVRAAFKDGGSIAELAEQLKTGRIKPDDVPPIRLVDREGMLFTLDNRRLEAFRRAGLKIRCRMATSEEAANESGKFTTKNAGLSVKVR